MDFEIGRQWLATLIAIGALVFGIWQRFASARKEELTKLEKRIADVETENRALHETVGKLQQMLKQLPDRDSVHDLALQLKEIAGDMKAMRERVNAIGNITERMDQYLMTAGHKT